MRSILSTFISSGPFLRRRDLLALGHTDRQIRAALHARSIFRVRQGWYAQPTGMTDAAIRAIRVGGKLTGLSALQSYGLAVPHPQFVSVAVPRNACRLRRPAEKTERLVIADGVRIEWVDAPRLQGDPRQWRVSVDDALLSVLRSEGRDVAIAACDTVMRRMNWSWARLDRVFERAPERVKAWRGLVVANSDAHGESFVRLWCADAGIPFEPQPKIRGVGRLDGRIAPHTYVEVDGSQHAEDWEGEEPSSFEFDHDRDTRMTVRGDRVLRFTYRQLHQNWDECVAAMLRAIDDDRLLAAARRRHPYVPRRPKRRRNRAGEPRTARRRASGARSPSF